MAAETDARSDRIALAQGVYFLTTGIWPIVHLPSFERVTGPKLDKWLVRMVGLLAASIGSSLLIARRRGAASPEATALAVSSAAAFAAIDVYYVLKGRISPIYLADAAIEFGLIAAWARRAGRDARSSEPRG